MNFATPRILGILDFPSKMIIFSLDTLADIPMSPALSALRPSGCTFGPATQLDCKDSQDETRR